MLRNCNHCGKKYEAPYHQKTICDDCIFQNCILCGTRFKTTTQQRRDPKLGKYCSRKCSGKSKRVGRVKKSGYWCVIVEDHPKAYKPHNYYYEHILIMEKKIGRYLKEGECVHHLNGDKLDNRPENLELHTRSSHSSYHWPAVSTSEDVGCDYSSYVKKRLPAPRLIQQGYVVIYDPQNPMSNSKGYVAEHRKIMSEFLGRTLASGEGVEHVNRNRSDNRLENLRVVKRSSGNRKPFQTGKCTGTTLNAEGYRKIWNPGHPNARSDGYVLAHRAIMAEHLDRPLESWEHVHHINGNRQDNRLANLELIHRKEHPSKHFRK